MPTKRNNSRGVQRDRVDDLEELRQTLGPEAENYTLAQLRQVQDDLRALADILIDIYLSKHSQGRR